MQRTLTRNAIRRTLVPLAATSLTITLIACSDSDDNDTVDGGDDASSVYVVQSATQTPDFSRTVYLNVIENLTDPIDASRAIELGSSSRVRTAFGDIFTFNSETLEISRFSVEGDLSLTQAPEQLSMANIGVGFYGWSHAFISETRAVYADDGSRQFVIWNPEDMSIITALPYGDELPANSASGQSTISADGQYVFIPFNVTDYSTLATDGGARVAIIDTTSDSVVDVLFDERCPGGQYGLIDPATGDYIYEGDANYGILHYLGTPNEVAPCFLRIPNGDTAFDPDWIMAGSQINEDGHTVVSTTTVAGDQFLTFARDDNEAPIADLQDPFAYFGTGSYWRFYTGSTSDWNGTRVDGPEGSSMTGPIDVVDGSFVTSPVDFDNRTASDPAPIYRLDENNEWEYLTETVGFVQRVERLR